MMQNKKMRDDVIMMQNKWRNHLKIDAKTKNEGRCDHDAKTNGMT